MNFRTLIDTARAKGLHAHRKPRTMAWVVRQTGISRAQIYNLIDGKQTAPTWTVAKIARGFKLTQKAVEAALAMSRDEAEVTS